MGKKRVSFEYFIIRSHTPVSECQQTKYISNLLIKLMIIIKSLFLMFVYYSQILKRSAFIVHFYKIINIT